MFEHLSNLIIVNLLDMLLINLWLVLELLVVEDIQGGVLSDGSLRALLLRPSSFFGQMSTPFFACRGRKDRRLPSFELFSLK